MPENNFENNDSAGRDLNPEARSHEAAAREIRETADAPVGSHQKDLGGLSTGVMMDHFVADVTQTPVAATDSRSAEGAPVSLWRDAWRQLRKKPTFIIAALLAFRADLMAQIFDPGHARAIGLPVRLLHYGLLALVALAVVAALQAVGLILSVALLITPGATAFLWARRFGPMLGISAAIGAGGAILGVYASFWLDSAPAPTIVLVYSLAFALSFLRQALRYRAARA